jgi:hypothetical protein
MSLGGNNTTINSKLFVPKSSEAFTYDLDGNPYYTHLIPLLEQHLKLLESSNPPEAKAKK